jgi:hypothetical protein
MVLMYAQHGEREASICKELFKKKNHTAHILVKGRESSKSNQGERSGNLRNRGRLKQGKGSVYWGKLGMSVEAI